MTVNHPGRTNTVRLYSGLAIALVGTLLLGCTVSTHGVGSTAIQEALEQNHSSVSEDAKTSDRQAIESFCPGVAGNGTCSDGVLEFRYTASERVLEGMPGAYLLPGENSGSNCQDLWIDTNNELTDIFARLAVQADGYPEIVWTDALCDQYLKLAVISNDCLELSVAGIRQCSAAELADCMDPGAFSVLMNQRNSLAGCVKLCTIIWEGEEVTYQGNAEAAVFDIRKQASTPGEVDQVTEVSVRLIDGQYEVGWPQRLTADYNQDGEVNGMDLTPIGILYGMSSDGYDWILESAARVDGDGNGRITVADITPLGYNYGNQLIDFRVEKSTGDASGPGENWESTGVFGRSDVTQHGTAVYSTSDVPYQRILTDTEPGWTYFRVIAIEGEGWEAEPSPAVLAPDASPPQWTAIPELTYDNSDPYKYLFTYNETAVDDRGVEYGFDLVGGDGNPDDLVVMLHITNENSKNPITSPYALGQYNFPLFNPGEYRGIRQQEGDQYHLRLTATDSGGNSVCSDWCCFIAKYGTNEFQGTSIADDWDVWVNREGTVRFTPPTVYSYDGLSPTDASIYHKIVPFDDRNKYNEVADYDSSTRVEYSGREITWDRIIPRNNRLWILIAVTNPDGTVVQRHYEIKYPTVWFKPFDKQNDEILFPFRGIAYLQDGSGYMTASHPTEDFNLLGVMKGGTVVTSSLEGIPRCCRSPKLNDVTGEYIFHEQSGRVLPGSVTWFEHPHGITGRADEPEGEFSSGFLNFNYILTWEAESEDVLVGVRGLPVSGEGEESGIEVWEAHRNGSISLRETVYPMEVKGSDYAEILPVRNNQLAMVIHVESGTNGLGAIRYHDFFAFRKTDGEWLVIDGEDELPGFNPDEWADVHYQVYSAAEDTAFVTVRAESDVVLDPVSEKYLQYAAVYRGSLKEGLESFSMLYDYRNDEVFHPDAGELRNAFFQLIKPYDGHALCSSKESYLVNPDGAVTHTGYWPSSANLLVRYGWDDHRYVPVLAKGTISEDGQWISPDGESVWGYAWWVD